MYSGVPHIEVAPLVACLISSLASPKSPSLTCPSASRRTFCAKLLVERGGETLATKRTHLRFEVSVDDADAVQMTNR